MSDRPFDPRTLQAAVDNLSRIETVLTRFSAGDPEYRHGFSDAADVIRTMLNGSLLRTVDES